MLKKLMILVVTLLISVTVCGQLLTPKRIVFEKDTGVFFKSNQELALLVKLKQLDACETEKGKWIAYADSADAQLVRERQAYDRLYGNYKELERVARDWETRYRVEYDNHQQTIKLLTIETDRKKKWRNWAIGFGTSTLTLTVAGIYILTH
jgi:hypothetical protein